MLLEEGIEAFIPNSELSTRRISRPGDAVKEEDQMEARIIEVKPDERKMTLSVRRLAEDAQRSRDAEDREAEYREFKEFSTAKKPRAVAGGAPTLGDALSEQFAALRGASGKASRKGRSKTEPDKYEASEDEE